MSQSSECNLMQQKRTAHLERHSRQLIGARGIASNSGGIRGYGCTWDGIGLTGWSIYGRRRARPQDPRDTAMA